MPTTLLDSFQQGRFGDGLLGQEAYRQLKQKIITLTLPPASLLREGELVAELGVGRTPIREALQRLACEKLVVIRPYVGSFVANLNKRDLWNLLEIWLALEPFAAGLAAGRASVAQIVELETLGGDLEKKDVCFEANQLIWLEYRAHRLLAQAAHNGFLEGALERMHTHLTRWHFFLFPGPGNVAERVEAWRAIFDAVKAGNSDQATRLMHRHLTQVSVGFREAVDT